jgi:hypothetical protein
LSWYLYHFVHFLACRLEQGTWKQTHQRAKQPTCNIELDKSSEEKGRKIRRETL